MNFYNDIDPKPCACTRTLIEQGLVSPGDVVCKSIVDVTPNEIKKNTQCHFFSGVCGWPLAFTLAGWPADRPVWSASLPCQPFSSAGKGLGAIDERNLWSPLFKLVKECRPEFIFGEQVAKAIGFNWLDRISADLEAEGYIVGSIVLGAHSVGAPHKRQRLYWMAYNKRAKGIVQRPRIGSGGATDTVADADGEQERPKSEEGLFSEPGGCSGMVLTDGQGRITGRVASQADRHGSTIESTSGSIVALGDTDNAQSSRFRQHGGSVVSNQKSGRHSHAVDWKKSRIIYCGDGKVRRIPAEPVFQCVADGVSDPMDIVRHCGLSEAKIQEIETAMIGFPLAGKIPSRVALLKGFGNAIVPQVAAQFIRASLEALNDL